MTGYSMTDPFGQVRSRSRQLAVMVAVTVIGYMTRVMRSRSCQCYLSLSLSLSLCVCVCVCACLLVFISEHCLSIFIRGIFAVMETIKNLFTPQAATQLKKGADTPGRPLQDQFEDQTAR